MTLDLRPATLLKVIETEDSNLILTVKATVKRKQAPIKALMLPHNRDQYMPSDEPDDVVESREITPYADLEEEDDTTERERSHQLRLTFNRPPIDIERGFFFGTDKQAYDVLLETKTRQGDISEIHFYITFNDEECLVLMGALNTGGTAVSYDGWGQRSRRRRDFKWILFLDRKNLTTAPTEPLSSKQCPIYVPSRGLGRGVFGEVVLVTDVSSAKLYAAKVFGKRAAFQNKMNIIRNISHRHIVEFVDFVDEHSPQMITEYLPGGNLEKEHKRH
ncbi:hypothetical protein AJ78_06317 [Emergomyces pasteurianus Ep9510]|uniref:Protein kinase domain-containing protein n=1 Tax=Emergomyces pasteurianus Ep9510 TaxID=1447872 RepID=A0A1J9QAL1_9EURO|nr:hypothetical protein AJ78_06317 [Emergomyces pasteurianus Ep9510]